MTSRDLILFGQQKKSLKNENTKLKDKGTRDPLRAINNKIKCKIKTNKKS